MTLRQNVYNLLEGTPDQHEHASKVRVFILSLIFLNVLAVVLESVDTLENRYGGIFYAFELFSVAVFTVEYLLRLWSCTEDPRYSRPVLGRLRFMVSPMAVIDVLAVLPFYLPMFVTLDLRFLRALRLLRVFRVLKAGRYSESLRIIGVVLHSRREELLIIFFIMLISLTVAGSVMYLVENEAQPDAFANIPAAIWWAVATMTTVGYGDVYPVTVIGKVLAGLIAVLGIAMFALPTGILGAGFAEEYRRRKKDEDGSSCPHCGEPLDTD